tara:strand:- start:5574 stop:6200 length:627 start_codon:yes stop_codon:yes gene_type:complete
MVDKDEDISEIIKPDQGFVSHVFNFDNKSKQELTNIFQYAILAIFPIVILNKIIQRLIPEADDMKGSIEILAEISFQLGLIFIGMFFIHRIITYLPTYSEAKYDSFSVINSIISFLIIILSLQTKLGEKMNIITDRILLMINNTPVSNKSNDDEEKSNYSVPILNTQNPIITNSQMQEQSQPQMNYQEPEFNVMAANDALGGAFGSSF